MAAARDNAVAWGELKPQASRALHARLPAGDAVRRHVDAEWAKLSSPNAMRLSVEKASFPWHRQPDAPNFGAAAAATRRVHGVDPGYTREG